MIRNRSIAYEYKKIYEKHFGKIPKGYHIHHIDGNSHNNDIKNLVCLSPEEHSKIHKDEFVVWANEGGRLGGQKCVEDKLGWFNKTEEELQDIRIKALKIANTKENIEKRVNTYKKRYSDGQIVHWSTLYDKDIVSEKIKKGDPGKSTRGKVSKNKGKKLNIKNIELANENKRVAALNRKKISCKYCNREMDAGNMTRHENACKSK